MEANAKHKLEIKTVFSEFFLVKDKTFGLL